MYNVVIKDKHGEIAPQSNKKVARVSAAETVLYVNDCCSSAKKVYPKFKYKYWVRINRYYQVVPYTIKKADKRPLLGKWIGAATDNCCDRLPFVVLDTPYVYGYYEHRDADIVVHYCFKKDKMTAGVIKAYAADNSVLYTSDYKQDLSDNVFVVPNTAVSIVFTEGGKDYTMTIK